LSSTIDNNKAPLLLNFQVHQGHFDKKSATDGGTNIKSRQSETTQDSTRSSNGGRPLPAKLVKGVNSSEKSLRIVLLNSFLKPNQIKRLFFDKILQKGTHAFLSHTSAI
jgi:hypothetical protein